MNITDEKKETVNGWEIVKRTACSRYGEVIDYRVSMERPNKGYICYFFKTYKSAVKFCKEN